MKKTILAVCLLLLASVAMAQPQDTLLTQDGTLFTIATETPEKIATGQHEVHLVLTARDGETTWTETIPATVASGTHTEPAMAYEPESRTLFVFWIRHRGLMYNELVFAARSKDGSWSTPTAFGNPYDYRENLRISVTRKVRTGEEENPVIPGVTVHATWWQFDSFDGHEAAHYAMLSIENGSVASIEYLDLERFADRSVSSDEAQTRDSADVIKQPLLFNSPTQDSVLVLFGDLETRKINRVRVFPTKPPVSDGRLRVPIGRTEGIATPSPKFAAQSTGRVDAIYGDSDRLVLYRSEEGVIRYSVLKDGKWSTVRSIPVDAQFSTGAAVDALRRLATEQ